MMLSAKVNQLKITQYSTQLDEENVILMFFFFISNAKRKVVYFWIHLINYNLRHFYEIIVFSFIVGFYDS